MKTLKNHQIYYDAECPICQAYTQGFVKSGMLERNGRLAYQDIPVSQCPNWDPQRAVNEIALVNTQTGEITYGIKSLFKILSHSFPIFKPLFSAKLFIWIMSKFYAFISYNRRVIIPVKPETFAYQPSFKIHYRIGYILFTSLGTGFILTHYVPLMNGLISLGNPYREYVICSGQVFFQAFIILSLAKEKIWSYLGNMTTISFAGALLLTPMIGLNQVYPILPWINAIYFMGVVGLMVLEHIRRTKILKLGWVLTLTWVLYRIILLFIILKIQ